MKTMLRECRAARRAETGGVLIGRYSTLLDRALVDEATPPPRDSTHATTTFARGFAGLREVLRRRWRRHRHYVGEWHFHPYASARPSSKDLLQMVAFALDPSYQCKRPILVVVGGDPHGQPELTVTVVRTPDLMTLLPAIEGALSAEDAEARRRRRR